MLETANVYELVDSKEYQKWQARNGHQTWCKLNPNLENTRKTTMQNMVKSIKENPIPSKKQTYIINCKKCGKQFKVFITPNLFEKGKYTKDSIPYIGLDNKQHSYLIDFKVHTNDNKFYYIQTKGYLHNDDQIKWKATRDAGYRLDVYFLKQLMQSEEKYNII